MMSVGIHHLAACGGWSWPVQGQGRRMVGTMHGSHGKTALLIRCLLAQGVTSQLFFNHEPGKQKGGSSQEVLEDSSRRQQSLSLQKPVGRRLGRSHGPLAHLQVIAGMTGTPEPHSLVPLNGLSCY